MRDSWVTMHIGKEVGIGIMKRKVSSGNVSPGALSSGVDGETHYGPT
jgi:hypothetical protein